MGFEQILAEHVALRPAAAALVDTRDGKTSRLTFADLDAQVQWAAAWLEAQGLRQGDAILVFVPMSAELYVAILAMFRLGVVALFVDPSAGRGHLEQCCMRWPPQALLGTPKAHLLRLGSPVLRRIPRKFALGGWLPGTPRWLSGAVEKKATGPNLGERDPALVTFTSGSTGQPKGAVRTHGFLLAQHRALVPNIALQAGQVDLATLPIFTLANLASGVTTIIPDVDLRRPGSIDARRVFAQVKEFEVTRITASPAFFERLIAESRATGEKLAGLRHLHTGGAPVFPRLLDGLAELAPNADIVAVYGSTEAEPIAHLALHQIDANDRAAMQGGRGLLAGPPVAEVKLRVLRDRWGQPRGRLTAAQLAADTLAADQAGEIVVAGEHVLGGYLGGIGDDETKFTVDGQVWHRTGDAGFIDERSRLWLLGRCAARITDERGELHPFAVECVAMTWPEVRRAAAVAHRGRRWLLVEAPGSGNELTAKIRAATAWAKLDEVRLIEALPVDKRHNAKIDYPALHRWLERET